MIPFQLHRLIPLVRRPFFQKDQAIRQREQALADLRAVIRDRDKLKEAIAQQSEDATWNARGRPVYDEDALTVWHKSIDFIDDPRFVHAYTRGMDSGHQIGRAPGSKADIGIRWRVAIACWAAAHASRLPGDFVECGVNTGMLSLAICNYLNFNQLDKTFWLFDTFEGIPKEQMSDTERALGREGESAAYYPPCYEVTKGNFAEFPRAKLIKGKVPDTLASAPIKAVSYLSIDMNITLPERAAIEHFWPRMVRGGIIVLDDYGWSHYREQKQMMDDFANAHGVEVMMLPTGQGLLLRS